MRKSQFNVAGSKMGEGPQAQQCGHLYTLDRQVNRVSSGAQRDPAPDTFKSPSLSLLTSKIVRITCLVLSHSMCDNSLQQPSKLRRSVHGEAGGMGTIPFPLVAAPRERLPCAPSSQSSPRGCSGQMRTYLPLGSGWFRNGHTAKWTHGHTDFCKGLS